MSEPVRLQRATSSYATVETRSQRRRSMVASSAFSTSDKRLAFRRDMIARRSSMSVDPSILAGAHAAKRWDVPNIPFSTSWTQPTASLFSASLHRLPSQTSPTAVGGGGSILREIRAGGYKESWGENPELLGEDPLDAGQEDEVHPPILPSTCQLQIYRGGCACASGPVSGVRVEAKPVEV